jgi:hypothetical protein
MIQNIRFLPPRPIIVVKNESSRAIQKRVIIPRVAPVGAGYHHYFSYRSLKTSRAVEILPAIVASTGGRGTSGSRVSTYRRHHRYRDIPGDYGRMKLLARADSAGL